MSMSNFPKVTNCPVMYMIDHAAVNLPKGRAWPEGVGYLDDDVCRIQHPESVLLPDLDRHCGSEILAHAAAMLM
jgi:hypothetical protein